MLSIRSVNKALVDEGINAVLVRGKDYFYFVGDDVEHAFSTTIEVCRVNHLDLDDWLEHARQFKEESTERKDFLTSESAFAVSVTYH